MNPRQRGIDFLAHTKVLLGARCGELPNIWWDRRPTGSSRNPPPTIKTNRTMIFEGNTRDAQSKPSNEIQQRACGLAPSSCVLNMDRCSSFSSVNLGRFEEKASCLQTCVSDGTRPPQCDASQTWTCCFGLRPCGEQTKLHLLREAAPSLL